MSNNTPLSDKRLEEIRAFIAHAYRRLGDPFVPRDIMFDLRDHIAHQARVIEQIRELPQMNSILYSEETIIFRRRILDIIETKP